ncbi:MAG: 50S ribosomal protein L4 [Chloroflexi bacterium]|nr:50S ribosomal protein L4 [Chloroflexota bacterium]
MELQVKDISGKVVGNVEADDTVWGADQNKALLHQAVVAQQANRRQGTQDTQTRAEVSYSTRKLRAQKGGGRARLGSRKSPNLRGGGVAHGPHPRSYRQKFPKKMRRQALRVALADHVRGETLIVLDALPFDPPKTRSIIDMVAALELRGRTLIVTAGKDKNVLISCANVQKVAAVEARNLSVLQTVSVPNLVITRDAVKEVDTLWGKGAAS